MRLNATSPAAARVSQTLTRYLQLNRRNARELIKKKAGDVAIQLFKATRAVAPEPATIIAAVKRLGWRVKRKKGAWPRRPLEKDGKKALGRMQAGVINRRIDAIGAAAAGYLPAVWRLRDRRTNPTKELNKIKNPRGRVEFIAFESDRPSVLIANSMPGAAFLQEKHDVVSTALNAVSDDMQKYIDRKLEEAANAAGLKNG